MNIFESTNRKSVPVRDVLKGLDSIAKNYDSEMDSAKKRVDAAEYRARQAEKRAENAESEAKKYHKQDNDSNQELEVAIVKLLGIGLLIAGETIFELFKNRKSKK